MPRFIICILPAACKYSLICHYDVQQTTKAHVLKLNNNMLKISLLERNIQKTITEFKNMPLDARPYHCSAFIAEMQLADGQ